MAIPVGTLVKGTVGTSLLGGGITTGALYENSKKNYSDFISKLEGIVVAETEKHAQAKAEKDKKSDSLTAQPVTIGCAYWTSSAYSHWTKERKLLECAKGWNDNLKKSIELQAEQMDLIGKVINKNYSTSTFTKTSSK